MVHLQSLRMKNKEQMTGDYPFSLQLVRDLDTLTFRSPVTFFIGENGSGKSTILEAIAVGVGAIVVGGSDLRTDPTLAPLRRLAEHFTFGWRKRTHRGFFLRAEDFFNFASRTSELMRDLDDMADDFERRFTGEGLRRSRGAVKGQRRAIVGSYGEDLHARSHGESFLQIFQARFVPNGLYLLDEPDTALSPLRQLGLLSMLKDMVEQDAQFIIATHSPIVMAFPGATILAFDGQSITEIDYDDVENVRLTKDFLANPEAFLRHL